MRLRHYIGVAVLLVLAAGGLLVASLWQPYAGFSEPVFLDIPKGTTARRIAALLAGNGVIRHSSQFLLARALRPRATLQAGEYRFDRAASVWDIYGRLMLGDVFYYELLVPEGSNIFDIAASVDSRGIMRAGEFLRAAEDPALIRDLAPQAATLEGYLFPSTYRLTRHTTAEQLCRLMTGEFRREWKSLSTRARVHDTVTLASLVEKETAVDDERGLIAAVFQNRLRQGMRLECDPTTIYAALLEERYRGTIYRSDLESKHHYNTYQHAGLPPGPIANPGLQSLKAAIDPVGSDYLFFVAKPDGSGAHVFSKTLAEHERAVGRYRRGIRKADEKKATRRISRGAKSAQGR